MLDIVQSTAFALSAFVISWSITWIVRRWAQHRRILDIPNERSSHAEPKPLGGGIGILGAFVLCGSSVLVLHPSFWITEAVSLIPAGLIGVAAGVIALVSWIDDSRRELSYKTRLAAHSAAAGIALIAVGGWDRLDLPFVGSIELGWLGIVLAFLWIVGLVNTYNFMDGIDGNAGAQAVVAAAGWTVLGVLLQDAYLSVFGLLLGSASAGFLVHNWAPAKIFMGDVGSTFLGFAFSMFPLAAKGTMSGALEGRFPVAGFLMGAPFILDAVYTLGGRIFRKENIFQAHQSHLYQRLVLAGWSHRRVTLLYSVLGLAGVLAGIGFVHLPSRTGRDILAVGASVIILVIPLFLTKKMEKRKAGQPAE